MLARITLAVVLATSIYTLAPAQSLGDQIRNQVLRNAQGQRGNYIAPNLRRGYYPQSNYYSRRPLYGYGGYGYGYSVGPSPYGHGYNLSPNYGYGYGYNPGVYLHSFGTRSGQTRTNLGNRQATPGSNYFGPPHASQYIPGNR